MADKITLPCSNGFTLCTDGENIVVSKGKSEEIIPISKIQGFSLKEPGLAYGKITFATAQAVTAGINVGFGVGAALGAEKTFFYAKGDVEIARKIRDAVMNYGKQADAPDPATVGVVVSVVDEIRGLKALLDDGILTEAEFSAKKAQLLGI